MGSFNLLLAPVECTVCGDQNELKRIQFQFGTVDGTNYHLGDIIDWFPGFGEGIDDPREPQGIHHSTCRPKGGNLKAIGYYMCPQCEGIPFKIEEAKKAHEIYGQMVEQLKKENRLQPVTDVPMPARDFVDKLKERGCRYYMVDNKIRADIYLLKKYHELTGKHYLTVEEVLITVESDRIKSAELTIQDPFYHRYPIVEAG